MKMTLRIKIFKPNTTTDLLLPLLLLRPPLLLAQPCHPLPVPPPRLLLLPLLTLLLPPPHLLHQMCLYRNTYTS